MTENVIEGLDENQIKDRRTAPKVFKDLSAALVFLAFFSTSVVLAIIGIVKIAQADLWNYEPAKSPGAGYHYDTVYGWVKDSGAAVNGHYFDHFLESWVRGDPLEYIDPRSSLGNTSFIAIIGSLIIGTFVPMIYLGLILSTKQMKFSICLATLLSLVGGALSIMGLKNVGGGLKRFGNTEHIHVDETRIAFVFAIIIITVLSIVALISSSSSNDNLELKVISKMTARIPKDLIQITSVALLAQILVFIVLVLPLWGFFWVDKTSLLLGNYDRFPFGALFVFQFFCFYWYSEIIRNMVHVKLSNIFFSEIMQIISDDKLIQRRFGSICYASLRLDINNSVKRSLVLVAASEKDYTDSSAEARVLAIKEYQRLITKNPRYAQKTFSEILNLYNWGMMLPIGLSVFISLSFLSKFSTKGSLYGLMFFPYGLAWTFMASVLAIAEFNLITQIVKSGANALQICSEIDRKSYKHFVIHFIPELFNKGTNTGDDSVEV